MKQRVRRRYTADFETAKASQNWEPATSRHIVQAMFSAKDNSRFFKKSLINMIESSMFSAKKYEDWFNKIKELCTACGYTPNVKEYKQNPDAFKGHVGDVSTVIRIAITSRTNTPDLYYIMQILGKDEVMRRIDNMIEG